MANRRRIFFVLAILPLLANCTTTKEVKEQPSSGPVAHAPEMVVGDTWVTMGADVNAGSRLFKHVLKVVAVHKDGSYEIIDEVPETENRYKKVYDKNHVLVNYIDLFSGTALPFADPPTTGYRNFPLWVGKKWKIKNYTLRNLASGIYYKYSETFFVTKYEEISTKAGIFFTFRIDVEQTNLDTQNVYWREFWYSPDVKSVVKYRTSWGSRTDLLEFVPGGE